MFTRVWNFARTAQNKSNESGFFKFSAPWLCLLVLHVGMAGAQSPAPLALPDLHLTTNGSVYAIAKTPDDGIVVGGRFSEINGVARLNIARLDAKGTLDETWAPTVNGEVTALVVDADESVYAAGGFSKVNDEYRFKFAKISGVGPGNLVEGWHTMEFQSVESLVLDGNGSLFVGGNFLAGSSNDGRNLANLVKISCATGELDRDWNPDIGSILAAAYDGSGHLIASGESISLAKIPTIGFGEPDPKWMPANQYSQITAITIANDHSVFAGGKFCPATEPLSCVPIAKISESGAFDPIWRPSLPIPDGSYLWVNAMRTDSAGYLLVTGLDVLATALMTRISIGGQGLVDTAWMPEPDAIVRDLAVNLDGSVFLGGEFSHLGTSSRKALARIDQGGHPHGPAIDATFPGIVNAITVLQDGRAVVGGEFEFTNGSQSWTNLLRLNPDGSLDPGWNPRADGIVRSLASDAAQNVYVGGTFMHIGGENRRALAKLPSDGNGAADPEWGPSPGVGIDGIGISAIALSPQGDIFVGGDFWGGLGGQWPRYGLAKISAATGLVDPEWLPLYARSVQSIVVGPDGSVYVSGKFIDFIDNPGRGNIAKISGNGRGVIDPLWAPSVNGQVASIAVDTSSNVFIAGSFDQVDGQDRYRLAKLSGPTGTVDLNWSHTLYAAPGGFPLTDGFERGAVLSLDADAHLYFGGIFGAIDDVSVPFLARMDTAGSGLVDSAWHPSPRFVFRNIWPNVSSSDFSLPPIRAIAHRPDGTILLGGDFVGIGAFSRNGLAAVPSTAPRDSIFFDGFEFR